MGNRLTGKMGDTERRGNALENDVTKRTENEICEPRGERALSETITSGALSISKSWTYDTAGRLTSETVNGVTTSYSYGVAPSGGRQVTKTLPGGLTEITTYYRDGQLKSVTAGERGQGGMALR